MKKCFVFFVVFGGIALLGGCTFSLDFHPGEKGAQTSQK